MRIAAVALAALLGLAACDSGAGRPVAARALIGTVWQLTRLDGVSDAVSAAGGLVRLRFDASGLAVGEDECAVALLRTRRFATELTVRQRAIRYKSCADQFGLRLGDLYPLLRGDLQFLTAGSTLTLRRGDATATLVAAPRTVPAPTLDTPTLSGTRWRRAAGSFEVSDRGTVSVRDGCARLSGRLAGVMPLRVRDLRVADPSCGRAASLRRVFASPVEWTIAHGRLTLTSATGGRLDYTWRPSTASTEPSRLPGDWRLVAIVPEASSGPATAFELSIVGDRARLRGCGSVTTVLAVSPGVLRAAVPLARRGCRGDRAASAVTVLSFLRGPTLFQVHGDRLTLTDQGATYLVFDRRA